MARQRDLRPAGFDDLGLRRVLGDRLLPMLVAAMAFLAALALGGAVAAAALARHWRDGAAAALTVQVPQPGIPVDHRAATTESTRLDRVLDILRATPGIAGARALGDGELAELLRPWLGSDISRLSLPIPAMVEVHLGGVAPDLAALQRRLATAAPGTLLESEGNWARRLTVLALSLQACAWLALLVVAAVSAAVTGVATRGGLLARREAIEIVHGLGATDAYIAGRFARRAATLAGIGGAAGAALALPALLALAYLAAPFVAPASADAMPDWTGALSGGALDARDLVMALPISIWLALPALPLAAAAIGACTASVTVRRWLRWLP
jgi:cell division transport system permease protein